MAINASIGQITSAIQEGRRAFESLDYGPVIPSAITDIEGMTADWDTFSINPNIFVAGVSKWGDTVLRITK